MKKRRFKKIIIFSIVACTVIFGLCRLVLHSYFSLQTEVVQRGTLEDMIETNGWAVRDEVVVYSENKDALKYLVDDAGKVAKGGVIAQAYKSAEDAKISCRIDELDKEIKTLERLNDVKFNATKGFSSVNSQINGKIREMKTALNTGDHLGSEEKKQKLLYMLNERQIMLGKDINLENRIQRLKDEKDRLDSSGLNRLYSVTASDTGNFINYVDGYENALDYKELLKMNVNKIDLENLPKATLTGNEIGKIVHDNTWYMVCILNEQDAKRISKGQNLNMQFAETDSSQDIPCKVEVLTMRENQTEYVAIFSYDTINQSLARIRKANFKIKIRLHTGLKIDKNAIHQKEFSGDSINDVSTGVYIKFGNYLIFKSISPVFSDNSNVICSFDDSQENDKNYLQPGDMVVTHGTNLYDGKRVV